MSATKKKSRQTQRRRPRPVQRRYEVEFSRGAVIDCASKMEARAMARAHMARARTYRVQDAVIGVRVRRVKR